MEDDQDIDSGSEAEGAIDSDLFGAVDVPKAPSSSNDHDDINSSYDDSNTETLLQSEYPSGVVSAEDFFGLADDTPSLPPAYGRRSQRKKSASFAQPESLAVVLPQPVPALEPEYEPSPQAETRRFAPNLAPRRSPTRAPTHGAAKPAPKRWSRPASQVIDEQGPLPVSLVDQAANEAMWRGVSSGNKVAVKKALDAGADPDFVPGGEGSAVAYAAFNGDVDICLLLIQAGAAVLPEHECVEVAKAMGHTELAKLLKSHLQSADKAVKKKKSVGFARGP